MFTENPQRTGSNRNQTIVGVRPLPIRIPNHNQTLVRPTPGREINHNQTVIIAPDRRFQHNQTLVRR